MKTSLVVSWLLSGVAMAQSAGTFIQIGNLKTPRQFHTATLLPNGKVLIAGGYSTGAGSFQTGTTAEMYDPSNESFTATGGMIASRYMHTATLLPNGTVLIAGGRIQNGGDGQAGAELYDPAAGTFSATGSMTIPRYLHTATLLNNGKVLIAGGNYPYSQSAELYDPSTRTFTATDDMTEPGADTATLLPSGSVLITRSVNDDGEQHAELYDPATGTFARTGDFIDPPPGQRPTATLLANGKVLIAGGSMGDFGSATAQIYDPITGVSGSGAKMTAAINAWASATLLPDGGVLIAGRYDFVACSPVIGFPLLGGTCPGTAEVYDPASGTFSASIGEQSMEGHAATLLPDGTVLISGGWVCCGITIGSAELYHPAELVPSAALLSLSGDGKGQGAIQHSGTYQLVSPENPAIEGEIVVVYCSGLTDGSMIPPQVAIGGRMAEVLWFGNTPGYPGLNQINARMPSGVALGPAVGVRLNYIGRPSNEVTIGVQ
jgi:hypothetical protein